MMNQTKKQLASVLVLTAGLFMTISCGMQNQPVESGPANSDTIAVSSEVQNREYQVSELAQSLAGSCSFSEELTENEQYLENHLYNFMELKDRIADSTAFVPAGITPEEILVFRMKSAEDLPAMQEKLTGYAEYQRTEYGRYKASEVPKLDSPVMVASGEYLIYVISCDNAGAETMAKALFD